MWPSSPRRICSNGQGLMGHKQVSENMVSSMVGSQFVRNPVDTCNPHGASRTLVFRRSFCPLRVWPYDPRCAPAQRDAVGPGVVAFKD